MHGVVVVWTLLKLLAGGEVHSSNPVDYTKF
jgi:hypothetical protein